MSYEASALELDEVSGEPTAWCILKDGREVNDQNGELLAFATLTEAKAWIAEQY